MKKILYFLGSRSLWVMLGLIGLIILIWFIGPLIAIGEVRPLADRSIRMAVCIAILGLWLMKIIFRQYRESRRNAALLKEIRAAQEPILKNSTDTSSMSRQFAEMDKVLKNAKFSKSPNSLLAKLEQGQYLYQMPWYVVLGAAGSGKTTALKRSGLNFPLESTLGTSVSGLAGTRDCDWFLSDEAVLLDTAGRLSLHDDHSKKDSEDWEEFVSLLKRYRPKQPINGVLVTVGVDDLLSGKVNIAEMAAELRRRIHEMNTKLGIHFPVYLMVTKLDMLHGFEQFFSHLTEEQRSQYFGLSLSETQSMETPIASAANLLSQTADKLNSSMLGIINDLEDSQDKAAAFAFPEEFERLNQAVLSLLKELSKSSKFEQPIAWRGVYFSSSMQTGESFNPVLEGLQGDFQLSKKYSDTDHSGLGSNHSFFLNRLFTDIIFNEANLAGENKSWFAKRQALYWIGIAVIAAAVASGILLMFRSFVNNSNYLERVGNNATQLGQQVKAFEEAPDLLKAVTFAEQVGNTTKDPDIPDLSNPPLGYTMGLYQGGQMQEVGDSSYRRILQDNVMPLISYKLDELLRETNGASGMNGYNALKAYLMMFDKKHFDAAFMKNWLMTNLSSKEAANMDDVQKQSIERALNQILTGQNLIPSVPYDEELVEQRRQEITQRDIATMVFEDVVTTVAHTGPAGITPVSFSSMGGVQSHLLFRRTNGGTLKQPINFLYTKEAYIKKILPSLVSSAEKFFNEDTWVLGSYASLSQSKESVLADAQRIYFTNYIRVWKAYIAELSLVAPRNSNENIQIAKLLSEKSSPLVNIIKGISDNTTLNINNQLTDKAGNKITEWLNRAGLSKLLTSDQQNAGKDAALGALKQSTMVDDAFSDFHMLTAADANQAPGINSVTDAINDLYVYLVAVNVAVEKGVDLPPDEPFVKYKAEVNRLPSPFREMLDNFSGGITKTTDKVVDDKLMSLLGKQMTVLANSCQEMRKQGYPFTAGETNSVALESFTNVFGPNGSYGKFSNLSGQASVLAKSDSLDTVRSKNAAFEKNFAVLDKVSAIRQAYFDKGSETPKFDFSVKVLTLDSELDSVNFSYDGKSYIYNHGPSTPATFTWPAKEGDAQAKIDIASSKINSSGITTTGPWSIFQLVEKGDVIRQNKNVTVVRYNIKGKELVIELTTSSAQNPFDLNKLRSFNCA